MLFPRSGALEPVTTLQHSNRLKLEYDDNLMSPASCWSKYMLEMKGRINLGLESENVVYEWKKSEALRVGRLSLFPQIGRAHV